jgi:hypothetical protein
MREAKHNSRAKQISAFNGWNNQYGSDPWTYHEYHGEYHHSSNTTQHELTSRYH